jgi:hypothetical protein
MSFMRAMAWLTFGYGYKLTTANLSRAPALNNSNPLRVLNIPYEFTSFFRVAWFVPGNPHSRDTCLADLLFNSSNLKFSEPRDRVFGLIGLDPRLLAPGLAPDYTDSVIDVYCNATKQCIKESNGLWELEAYGYTRPSLSDDEGLLTWIPHWYHVSSNPRPEFWPRDCDLWPGKGQVKDLVAGKTTLNARTLAVQGIALEPILKHSGNVWSLDGLDFPFDFESVTCAIIQGVQDLVGDVGQASKASKERVNNVLVAGRKDAHVASALQDLFRLISQPPVPPDLTQQHTHGIKLALETLVEALYYCRDRKLFVTHSGRLGIGPETLKNGDVVAISRLSKWPMILRPEVSRGDHFYTMVGAAYVEEIKDGEAMFAAAAQGEGLRTLYLV